MKLLSTIVFLLYNPFFSAYAQSEMPDSLVQSLKKMTGIEKMNYCYKVAEINSVAMNHGNLPTIQIGLETWKTIESSNLEARFLGAKLIYLKSFADVINYKFEQSILGIQQLDSLTSLKDTPIDHQHWMKVKQAYLQGLVFSKQDNNRGALSSFLKMEKLLQQSKNTKNSQYSTTFVSIASEYGFLKIPDSAAIYAQKALEIYEIVKDTISQAGTLLNRGEMYTINNRLDAAAADYLRSAALVKPMKHPLWLFATVGYADVSNKKKSFEKAYQALLSIETEINDAEDPNLKFTYLEIKVSTLKGLGRFEEALNCSIKYSAIVDSFSKATYNQQILELQSKYETTQKNQEIALLKAENKAKTFRNWLLIALLALSAIGSYLTFYFFKEKRKKREAELKNENNILQERLNRLLSLHLDEKIQLTGNIEDDFIPNLFILFEKNLANEQFSIETLPKEIGISRAQFFKKVKDLTGKSPAELLRELRMQKAKKLLLVNHTTVAEVAYAIGFNSPDAFSRAFKTFFGESPSSIKKSSPEV
jgi:AraC-like DNA-binding protein